VKRSPEDGSVLDEPSFTEEPAPGVRKVIAGRMLESKLTIPHFYLFDEVDMDGAAAFREEVNAGREERISFNDIIVKAAARVLEEHPECNVSYHEGTIRTYEQININVAVAIEGALLVPTVRDCAAKSIFELSARIKELAEKARTKKLRARENMGGTFTISNLGVFGLGGSFSIINPPQAMILTTGAIREVPVVVDGSLAVGKRMKVTLSCDHRAVDGAVGARFLADLKNVLVNVREHVL
jgi:pyruvate dehydrogenase E2 component (dihydrolipoamide acetyltransferase)